MLADFMEYKKFLNRDKIDPGTFSFMEPGWWALHATAVAGVYMLGSMLSRNHTHHQHQDRGMEDADLQYRTLEKP